MLDMKKTDEFGMDKVSASGEEMTDILEKYYGHRRRKTKGIS